MKTETKLTTVNVINNVYIDFKIKTIDGSLNFQKLVNRSLDLYNNKPEFRNQIDNHTVLAVSGSKY